MKVYIIVDLPGVQVSLYEYTFDKAKDTAEGFLHPTILAMDVRDVIRLLGILKDNPQKTANAIAKLEEYV